LRPATAWETLNANIAVWGLNMQDGRFDVDRYRKLLAEAVDETRRLALIDVLVKERAKERLEAQRAADRKAMTASTIAKILGSSRH
jgi:hypothetical protein